MFKKVSLLAAALVAAAIFLVLPAWPGTLPTSIIPDGARWVAHLDMERFVASKLFQYMEKDGGFDFKFGEVNRWLKTDVPKDIAGVTLFGLGPGEKQAVFAVAGKFDKDRIMTLLDLAEDHTATPYGAYTLHATGHDGYGAFINDGLIVFSESREAIEKVLDTAAGKAKNFASSTLAAALKNVPKDAFLSGTIEDLAGLGRQINQSKIAGMASALFFTAQEKQENLQVVVQVTAGSPENAKNMADIAQGLVAMVKMSQGEGQGKVPASLIQGLQVKVEGKTVRLELGMPSRDIADLAASRGRNLSFFD